MTKTFHGLVSDCFYYLKVAYASLGVDSRQVGLISSDHLGHDRYSVLSHKYLIQCIVPL